MDDEPTRDANPDAAPDDLAGLADASLDEADATTLKALRDLYAAVDPPPTDLVERVRFSLAVDELFEEVARLTRVPLDATAVRGDEPAGTRTETLTFSADRLTAMVTCRRHGSEGLRLDGWLAPPDAFVVRLRLHDGPTLQTTADEAGRFVFEGLEEGFGQLSFRVVGDEAPGNAVVTPLFEL